MVSLILAIINANRMPDTEPAMREKTSNRGYTLRELLVVITIIAVLLALLVPAIQTAREAARRTSCTNNLRQIGIGLQNYHDTYKTFPMGAMHSGRYTGGDPPVDLRLGPSWWFGVMPFMESGPWYDRMITTQQSGGPANPKFCANVMNAAGVQLNTVTFYYMRCPSSGLPTMEKRSGPITLPTYVAITGGCDIDPGSYDYAPGEGASVAPVTAETYQNRFKGTGAAAGGIVTPSGMLPPCQHVKLTECFDGTSNTMIVAEQSDWLRDRAPGSSGKYHGDPGWTVGGTGNGGGFLSGTTRFDPLPPVPTLGGPPSVWGADCWNIATVRYPANYKRVMGVTPLPGCSENHGINNPLQSPHPGGLLIALADGSVHFVSQKTELVVLLRGAIRDDSPDRRRTLFP
jgi:prepilin-type N-terminal cleavage/methylation domain-containing protein